VHWDSDVLQQRLNYPIVPWCAAQHTASQRARFTLPSSSAHHQQEPRSQQKRQIRQKLLSLHLRLEQALLVTELAFHLHEVSECSGLSKDALARSQDLAAGILSVPDAALAGSRVKLKSVEFRQRMEYLDREYHAKTAALDERIAAVHEFDLSHVEKISKQESKIAALEQEIHALQKVLLDKDAQIVAVTETRANKQGPSEFSGTQRSLEAQLESFRSSLKDVRPADLTTNGSSSRIASLFLPEIHVSSENDLESTGAAQIRVKDPAPRISVGSTARVAMEQQNSEAQTGLEGSVVHRSSMRSALSTASLRNREFPSLSQSNMFMTPQTSRILDQHTKPLSYSLQKLAPAVTHDFSLSMASMSGNASNFARTQLQLPGETHHESSKSGAFSAEVDEMQRKIGRRLDALRESRLQKSEGKF